MNTLRYLEFKTPHELTHSVNLEKFEVVQIVALAGNRFGLFYYEAKAKLPEFLNK